MSKVTIIDYGHGNANSIKLALSSLGVNSTYSHEAKDVDSADFLILPGVGHHASAMKSLQEHQLTDALNRAALERKIPTLGICLGMQIMTRSSEEGGQPGLGWVDAETKRIVPANKTRYKVPHVGWNVLNAVSKDKASTCAVLEGIELENEPFYFCHSYAVKTVTGASSASVFRYDQEYVAVFEQGNVVGVQFHPEKSHDAGARLLSNFLKLERKN
jgi:imidazole glycerol-phosphate synthase subunit HisH